MTKTTYKEKLLDPRWQKKRLEVLSRDSFTCLRCGDDKSTLHVHHNSYKGNPWDVKLEELETICASCHAKEHQKEEPEFTYEHENHSPVWEVYPDKYDNLGKEKYTRSSIEFPSIYKNGHNTMPTIVTHEYVISCNCSSLEPKLIFGDVQWYYLNFLKYKNMSDLEYKEDYMNKYYPLKEWRQFRLDALNDLLEQRNTIITHGDLVYGADDLNNLKNPQYV